MRKNKDYQAVVLLTTILFVSLFHACAKKEGETPPQSDCKECYAIKNGAQVGRETICSESQKTTFKNEHPGAEVTCY